MEGFSGEVMEFISPEAFLGFLPTEVDQPNVLNFLPEDALQNITSDQLGNLPPTAFSSIDASTTADISPTAFAGLNSAQMETMPEASINAMTAQQIGNLDYTVVQGITQEQLGQINSDSMSEFHLISNVNPEHFSVLTSTHITYPYVICMLNPLHIENDSSAMSGFSAEKIAALQPKLFRFYC